MKRPRDSQRKKVYDWERKEVFFGKVFLSPSDYLTLEFCTQLVKRVYRDHNFPAPAVTNKKRGHAFGSKYVVELPLWARRLDIVLHEIAHGLTDHYAPAEAAHGRTFMGIYIYLLGRYGKQNANTLIRSARQANLEVNAQAACEFRQWRKNR